MNGMIEDEAAASYMRQTRTFHFTVQLGKLWRHMQSNRLHSVCIWRKHTSDTIFVAHGSHGCDTWVSLFLWPFDSLLAAERTNQRPRPVTGCYREAAGWMLLLMTDWESHYSRICIPDERKLSIPRHGRGSDYSTLADSKRP